MGVRHLRPEPWDDSIPGIRMRRLLRSPEADLTLYRVEPGSFLPAHSHRSSELGLVLEGGGISRVHGEVRHLRSGDSYYISSEAPHEFESNPVGATVIVDVEAHGAAAHRLRDAESWMLLMQQATAEYLAGPMEGPPPMHETRPAGLWSKASRK